MAEANEDLDARIRSIVREEIAGAMDRVAKLADGETRLDTGYDAENAACRVLSTVAKFLAQQYRCEHKRSTWPYNKGYCGICGAEMERQENGS